VRRLLLGLAGAAILAVGGATPAGAHAVLRGSEPLDRQVLAEGPARVRLRFSEPVALSSGSIRVLDHHGEPVVGRGATHVRGDNAQVELALPELGRGTYVVAWRVVSADSHPAVGAYSFRIGDSTDDFHVGASLFELPTGSRALGVTFGVARFALYSSLILLVGGAAFLALVWPAGRHARGPRRLVAWAGMAALASTAATFCLQGAYAAGGGLGDVLSPSAVGSVLQTRYGDATVARGALLVGAALAVVGLRRRTGRVGSPRRSAMVLVLAGVGAAALLATVSWTGHAATGRYASAALVLDVVHLAAVSIWVGGLAMMAGFVLRGGAGGHAGIDGAASAAARFSTVALGAVVVMVVTGTLQAWRQVGGLDELAATDFGRLLVAKIALVAAMLCAARYSRRLIRREAPQLAPAALSFGPGAAARDMPAPLARLRRSVAIEATVAMAVVAVTAALVNAIPPRAADETAGPALPFSIDLAKAGVRISVTLEPARTGLNDLHVYVIDDGPLDALEVSATMTLAAQDTGPITVPLVKSGAGHWSAFGFPVPIAGIWELEVAALVSEIDLVRVSTDVHIT